MSRARSYASKRFAIIKSLVEKFKEIDGSGEYLTNIQNQVSPVMLFWDEVTEFPSVHLSAGQELRDYQGGGFRDRYLSLTIRCYVNDENSVEQLESLLEDLETVIETNSRLHYKDKQGNNQFTQQISIMSIDTDEGTLAPLGAGEIICQVRY